MASSPARTERPSAWAASALMPSVTVVAPAAGSVARSTSEVLALPSPATLTHSRPEPFWPSAVQEAATGSGTATCASLLETAVLTTVPFT